jgi:heat shock protein HslJ
MFQRLIAAVAAVAVPVAVAPVLVGGAPATPGPEVGLPPVVWQLIAIAPPGGPAVVPDDPAKYTVQFRPDGRVAVRADCNLGQGSYTVGGGSLTIGPIATTRVACPQGSLFDDYVSSLGKVASFAYDGAALVLTLEADAGSMRFAPALSGVIWQWQGGEDADGQASPDDPSRYTVLFQPDGSLAVRADCNRGFGRYAAVGDQIGLLVAGLTRAACPPESLGDRFVRDLNAAVAVGFVQGDLALRLAPAGSMTFRATIAEEQSATPTAG